MVMPGGARARLSTLIFHRVTLDADPLFPGEMDAARFEQLCGLLGVWFNVLSLPEAIERLNTNDLPERAMAITFDDGYADNHSVAAPILRRFGLPCTFFVATGYLDGGCMWNDVIVSALRDTRQTSLSLQGMALDEGERMLSLCSVAERRLAVDHLILLSKYMPADRRQAFVDAVADRLEVASPNHLMMTSDQVRQLDRMGFGVGAHTRTHPILARLDRVAARCEIESCKADLENLLGHEVAHFAYPNGKRGTDYNDETVAVVREAGFHAALTTNPGVSMSTTDRFQLPRFTPWDRQPLRFAIRMARNAMLS